MDIERYNNIFSFIRGYPLEGCLKDFDESITWMKRVNQRRKE